MTNYVGPRCYAHQVPSFHGVAPGGPGLPAHVWGAGVYAECQRCPNRIAKGDRYLCADGGIVHAECPPLPPAALDPDPTTDTPCPVDPHARPCTGSGAACCNLPAPTTRVAPVRAQLAARRDEEQADG
jgi:hypothetical protein